MSIVKIFIASLVIMFSLNGCQGTNSDTPSTTPATTNSQPVTTSDLNNTTPSVFLPENNVTVSTNSQIVNIKVKVLASNNTPYSDGNVTIFYPDDAKYGRDIGSFSSSTVAISNGIANFVYTAPGNLDENTSNIVFNFYHSANPSQAQAFTVKIVPDVNQTVLKNYSLKSSFSDTNATMGLKSNKLMSFFIKDDTNTLIPDSMVTSITIEMLNPNLGQLEDTKGNSGSSLTIADKNDVTVNLKTKTISGIIPLKVTSQFFDSNNNPQTLTRVFNVVVLSGPPSAISFSYVGTDSQSGQNDAKMIENWVLTVTDRYNNFVNTHPSVSMGAIVGYAKSSANTKPNAGNYLYYIPSVVNGTISSTNNNFTASANVFDNVDQTNDYLATFGNGYTYNASGKWDINTNNANNTLDLVDTYEGNDTSNLGFAIGHNYRQDACDFGVESVANVYPEEKDNYTVDSTGNMHIAIAYDYYLVGKDIVLWANLVGKQYDNNTTVKIGEARKITLRGAGLEGESYAFSKGFSGVERLQVSVKDTTAWYKNARFSYKVTVTADDANWTVTGDSMDNSIISCDNNGTGIGYVDINFTSPAGSAGTVSLTNLHVLNEF